MVTHEELAKKYHSLLVRVNADHELTVLHGNFGQGHDMIHAWTIAALIVIIGNKEAANGNQLVTDQAIEYAWVAAIMHNSDRLFGKKRVPEILESYFSISTHFDVPSEELIAEAVINHSGPNDPEGSIVKTLVQEADRVGNLGIVHTIRCGQAGSEILACDPRFILKPDPRAEYTWPLTVMHDISCALEWDPEGPECDERFCLRLPSAIELARPDFAFIREGFTREQVKVLRYGLDKYPFYKNLEQTYYAKKIAEKEKEKEEEEQ